MYYWVLNYPCDKIYSGANQELYVLQEHDSSECSYLSVDLTNHEDLPIEKALLHIFKSDKFNEYTIVINSNGYHPVEISNIPFYPGKTLKLCIDMIPVSMCIYNMQSVEEIEHVQDDIRDMTFTLGLDSPKGSLATLYAEKFAEEVNTLSNGKIKIEVFTDAVLGNDRQMLSTIISEGSPDFIIQTTAPQVNLVPELSILDMPMVYNDINKLRSTMDNEYFYQKINNIYSSAGYKLLGMADEHFREMTTNMEIQDIEQFGGVKIRTIQNPNHIKFWQLLGGIVIPLPIGEVYESLVRGYIDAQENPYGNIAAFKFYEVQDYVINTNHLPHFLPLITSNDIYDSLNEQEKKIIEEAAKNATVYTRIKADERLEEVKQTLIDNGMTIVDLPERTRQDMIKFAAMPVYDSIRALVNDDELIDLYLEMSK
ncbi:TRAP transporter substrate-binding protein [Sedimentibacter saalensis]|uniref:TRAP transporter substrate-binding protein n=1 Tax=Sedimentibacter saalensis TaxID=130788 RepID=UPI00289F7154|nr:TRAP transporter substrate-binding protein [Sedimentibacter saalensis]